MLAASQHDPQTFAGRRRERDGARGESWRKSKPEPAATEAVAVRRRGVATRQHAGDRNRRSGNARRDELRSKPVGPIQAFVARSRVTTSAKAKAPVGLSLPSATLATPAAKNFADSAAAAVSGGVIRYSARAALLKEAGLRNIPRFEANLIIAAVQHRMAGVKSGEIECAAARKFDWKFAVTFFVIFDAALVLGVWHWLR
jgi:hypothetical protein